MQENGKPLLKKRNPDNPKRKVHLGPRCWAGTKAHLLLAKSITSLSIIGAHSLINKLLKTFPYNWQRIRTPEKKEILRTLFYIQTYKSKPFFTFRF